jgi:circadian clock protein KaiB
MPRNERAFEQALVNATRPRSASPIQDFRVACDQRLPDCYQLEVVDLYRHPEQARPEQIDVTATLLKAPLTPVHRLIGDLSNRKDVLVGLDLTPRTEETRGLGHGP